MKILLVAFFIAATSATLNFDLSEIETKKLLVPQNPDEFLTSKLSSGLEKSRDGRIANGTDAVDGQFPYAVRQIVIIEFEFFSENQLKSQGSHATL